MAGVGGVPLNGGIKNSLNWAPRVGVTYQLNEKTVIRGGYGRSYDIGVFGSLFGHTVTQNLPVLSAQSLSGANSFDDVFNLSQPAPAPVFRAPDANGQLLVPPGVFTRALPDKQRPPTVDAYNVTVQRELGHDMSVEVAYVGNHGARVFVGDGPSINGNQPTLVGFPARSHRISASRTSLGTVGPRASTCSATAGRIATTRCRRSSPSASPTATPSLRSYTLQRQRQHDGDQFFYLPDLEYGPADWDRMHSFTSRLRCTSCHSRERTDGSAGGSSTKPRSSRAGTAFDVSYRDAGADRDTGPNRPNLIGNPDGPGTRDEWFNAAPIGDPNSAFCRPAVGTFGNMAANVARGPGYWRVDASLFKTFRVSNDHELEVRFESVNFLNHVNLGNPDRQIGVPGNLNTNAGRITSTAYGSTDPQRNFQFAVKYRF